jgi:hypothetical protein
VCGNCLRHRHRAGSEGCAGRAGARSHGGHQARLLEAARRTEPRGTDAAVQAAFGGGTADQLPARGVLGLRARAALDSGAIEVRRGSRTAAVEPTEAGGLRLTAENGQVLDAVDEVVVLTGFRPDLTWLSEVRLDLDPVLQARASSPH